MSLQNRRRPEWHRPVWAALVARSSRDRETVKAMASSLQASQDNGSAVREPGLPSHFMVTDDEGKIKGPELPRQDFDVAESYNR